jgi:hypothetical protein
MFARRWRVLAPGGLQAWRFGHETCARWALDRPTPMERMRILDPRPDAGMIRETLARARELIPGLAKVRSPPNGRATSTRRRTGCRRSARPAVPGLVLAGGLQRPRLRHRPGRRPHDRRHRDRRAPDPRPRALRPRRASTAAPGARSRTSDSGEDEGAWVSRASGSPIRRPSPVLPEPGPGPAPSPCPGFEE